MKTKKNNMRVMAKVLRGFNGMVGMDWELSLPTFSLLGRERGGVEREKEVVSLVASCEVDVFSFFTCRHRSSDCAGEERI